MTVKKKVCQPRLLQGPVTIVYDVVMEYMIGHPPFFLSPSSVQQKTKWHLLWKTGETFFLLSLALAYGLFTLAGHSFISCLK